MSLFSKSEKQLATELAAAIRENNPQKVQRMYARGVKSGPLGENALVLAVIHDREKIVEFLLAQGEDPKQRYDGLPLVMYALDSWRSKITQKLLYAGADPNDKGDGQVSPVMKALEKYRHDALAALIEHGADPDTVSGKGEPLLVAAVRQGNMGVTRSLLDKGANIHAADLETGATALHHAAKLGRADLVLLLMERGADERRGDRDMRTPVSYAEKEQHHAIAAILRGERPGAQPAMSDDWLLVGAEEVARVTAKHALRYSVTEIFNFSARTYTQVMRNMDTGAESQAVKAFSAIAEGRLLQDAQDALQRLGGHDPQRRAKPKLPGPAGLSG